MSTDGRCRDWPFIVFVLAGAVMLMFVVYALVRHW